MATGRLTPPKRKATSDDIVVAVQEDGRIRKKARFLPLDDNSDFATSAPPSVADTFATSTVAQSTTPFTDATSTRSGKPRTKKYQCPFQDCDKAYSRPIHLQGHINSHTGERPHACTADGCDKTFTQVKHLNRHIQDKHTARESKTCTFVIHDDTKGIAVPCGKIFANADHYKRHIARHEEKEETRCTWENCSKVFRKQETLQRHIRKDHLNELPYVCTRDIANGGQCGEAFGTPGMLKRHIEHEHEAPRYFCNLCNHPKGIFVQPPIPIANDLDPEFLPTPEDLQGDDFDSNIIRSLTLDETAPIGTQYPDGAVGFTTYGDLQHHLKVMHPPTCDECGKLCKSRKDLAAHMDIHHGTGERATPAKSFLCPYPGCPRSQPGNGFGAKNNMNTHIKSIHRGERNFKCGEYDLGGHAELGDWNGEGCGMPLVSKAALINHVKTQHLGMTLSTRKSSRAKTAAKERASMKVDSTLSMITGFGYEQNRPFACLVASEGCQMRFVKNYDMCVHMELTHGWNVDDINDAVDARNQAQIAMLAVGNEAAFAHESHEMAMEDVQSMHAERMLLDPQLGDIM